MSKKRFSRRTLKRAAIATVAFSAALLLIVFPALAGTEDGPIKNLGDLLICRAFEGVRVTFPSGKEVCDYPKYGNAEEKDWYNK